MQTVSEPKPADITVIVETEAVDKLKQLLMRYKKYEVNKRVSYLSVYNEIYQYIKHNPNRFYDSKEGFVFKIHYFDKIAALCVKNNNELFVEDFVSL